MPKALRLYLDENVSEHVAVMLRRVSLDVLTVKESGLLSRDDADQLHFATSTGRVLVTHDRGIRDTHWLHQPHSGVFFAPQRTQTAALIEWLEMAALVLSADEMLNRLESYRS